MGEFDYVIANPTSKLTALVFGQIPRELSEAELDIIEAEADLWEDE